MNTIVIFGASGDLTSRKLVPALYQLFRKKRLPTPFAVVGMARTHWEHAAWRASLAETTRQFTDSFDTTVWAQFAPHLFYHSGDLENPDSYRSLDVFLRSLESASSETNRVYYMATAPQFYGNTARSLAAAGMAEETTEHSRRIVIEKPFGTSLQTAQQLNDTIHGAFDEKQVYRIDHYLGKETVNNILALRFANTIFEPVWNRNYIEHIQITASEDVVVGSRGSYYDTAGILRDMFQNHLLQILTFVMMEAPARFDAKSLRDEKVKVLQAISPMTPSQVMSDTVRGQYRGYRNEKGVAADSRTGTFVAVKLTVDNWRWSGVPVYLRTGKGMSCRTTQILIQFRKPPHALFPQNLHVEGNRMLIQIQPAEGIQIHFQTKVPDTEMQLRMTDLSFNFKDSFRGELPEAYQRLLSDVFHGDPSLFARSDEVETAWTLTDPIQTVWDSTPVTPPEEYDIGDWGPPAAAQWIRRDGYEWFDLCPLV